jgi:hypothetical protein
MKVCRITDCLLPLPNRDQMVRQESLGLCNILVSVSSTCQRLGSYETKMMLSTLYYHFCQFLEKCLPLSFDR